MKCQQAGLSKHNSEVLQIRRTWSKLHTPKNSNKKSREKVTGSSEDDKECLQLTE